MCVCTHVWSHICRRVCGCLYASAHMKVRSDDNRGCQSSPSALSETNTKVTSPLCPCPHLPLGEQGLLLHSPPSLTQALHSYLPGKNAYPLRHLSVLYLFKGRHYLPWRYKMLLLAPCNIKAKLAQTGFPQQSQAAPDLNFI